MANAFQFDTGFHVAQQALGDAQIPALTLGGFVVMGQLVNHHPQVIPIGERAVQVNLDRDTFHHAGFAALRADVGAHFAALGMGQQVGVEVMQQGLQAIAVAQYPNGKVFGVVDNQLDLLTVGFQLEVRQAFVQQVNQVEGAGIQLQVIVLNLRQYRNLVGNVKHLAASVGNGFGEVALAFA